MKESLKIISLGINPIGFEESLDEVMRLGLSQEPSWVAFANVHMTMEAYKDPVFRAQLANADLVLADGRPIAAACHWLYGRRQERIAGMDFMPRILEKANQWQASVFLYGATAGVLATLEKKIGNAYPKVKLAGTIAPPFRKLTEAELQDHIAAINHSNTNIVLVALGCPKQEKWMAENHAKINAVLLGVGGAFAVMAGMQKRSPQWMQRSGLEWMYRLFQEPGRLFSRYLSTNTQFIWLMGKELLKSKHS